MDDKLKNNVCKRIDEVNLFSNKFNTFTKSDFELLMFTAYLDSCSKPIRDYDISIALGMPETKVRNLRLKSQLVYPKNLLWKEELAECIKHGSYDKGSKLVTVTFEDPSVKALVKNEIEKQFGTVNLSFNNKQLVMPVDSFVILAVFTDDKPEQALKNLNHILRERGRKEDVIEDTPFKDKVFDNISDVGATILELATVMGATNPIIAALGVLCKGMSTIIK